MFAAGQPHGKKRPGPARRQLQAAVTAAPAPAREMAGSRKPPALLLVLLYCAIAVACGAPVDAGGGEKDRGEKDAVYKEKQGNSTYQCAPAGLCLPCTSSEKNDDTYACSRTSYHQSWKCTEILSSKVRSKSEGAKERGRSRSGKNGAEDEAGKGESGRRRLLMQEEVPSFRTGGQLEHRSARERGREREKESLSADPAKPAGYYVFKSCIPAGDEERLSVLGFEMMLLALLAVCGPFVHYRKKKQFSAATRSSPVPSNSRF